MAIVRWNPMKELFWDDFGKEFRKMMRGEVEKVGEMGEFWAPSIDLSETPDAYTLKADLPGMNSEDVNVEVHDDIITISGERKEERSSEEENVHVTEVSYGKFMRSVRLPISVDPDKVKAKFENGVLKVSLPKSEKVKPKKIEIEK